MPGPMGGGRGGGFSGGSRGGGFSGGSRGGGFSGGSRGPVHHGPHHHGHHHHHGPIFIFGPRRRYYGGGYHGGGGSSGAIIGAVICFFIVFALIIGLIFASADNGIGYDEQRFQEYANEQYYAAFSDTEDYEGNILLVFLVYEGYDGYDCIPWGGYNIDAQTEELFGAYFEATVRSAIPNYYEHALTKSLRQIVDKMTNAAPNNAASGTADTSHSMLYNNTSLEIEKTIVNGVLEEFTEKTGYPIAIVVEDGEEIYSEEDGSEDGIIMVVIMIIIIIIIIAIAIIIISSTKKNKGGGGSTSKTTDKTNPDAGQGKYDPNTGEWK